MCKPKIKTGTAIIMLQKIKQSRHDIWELDALDLAIDLVMEKLERELEECSESE